MVEKRLKEEGLFSYSDRVLTGHKPNFIIEKDNFVFSFKPWYRIKEDKDDDNPDIEKYLGHFELQSVYKYNDHSFALMVRNNLRTGENRGAAQLDWTFPLHRNFKGYVQWFNGYGESLIDYNHNVNAIGLGYAWYDPKRELEFSLSSSLKWMGDAKIDQSAQGVRASGEFSTNYLLFIVLLLWSTF